MRTKITKLILKSKRSYWVDVRNSDVRLMAY